LSCQINEFEYIIDFADGRRSKPSLCRKTITEGMELLLPSLKPSVYIAEYSDLFDNISAKYCRISNRLVS